jgi:hypothetical protein
MSDALTIRMYNVRFGDAILVTVPDRDPATNAVTKRRILIDVGNAPLVASAEGGDDTAFKPVIEDILAQLNGEPLDLYVMTHEHLDHVQGLPHAAWKLFPEGEFLNKFKANHVWLTASAHPDYYDNFPNAKKGILAVEAQLAAMRTHVALHAPDLGQKFYAYLKNNSSTQTKQCVEFLRKLNPAKTAYIFRGKDLTGFHPFKEAKFEVWAPEEDTSDYYGTFQPMMLAGSDPADPSGLAPGPTPLPPPGVDLGAFLNLVQARRNGIVDNLLAIDQAANNTSVVFCLEWREWRLLFSGDAEIRSWKTMRRENVLKPVHFLKVSHHGSHNGTPSDEILELILPTVPPDDRLRHAAISTWSETYSGIPHSPTNTRLKSRCTLKSTLDDPDALFFELSFEAEV